MREVGTIKVSKLEMWLEKQRVIENETGRYADRRVRSDKYVGECVIGFQTCSLDKYFDNG